MCEFVQQVDSCRGDGGFLHYFEFVYCIMPISLVPLSMTMLVSTCVQEWNSHTAVSVLHYSTNMFIH